jgi:hypothetical protein
VHLAACKKFLFKNFDTTFSPEYLETDDLITIRAYEELALGNRPILATIDKDAYQSQGIELLNGKFEELIRSVILKKVIIKRFKVKV